MPKKIGSRLTDAQRENISKGMIKHHAKRREERMYKVNIDDRQDILKLYNEAQIPIETLAGMYNISVKHLYKIIELLRDVEEVEDNE